MKIIRVERVKEHVESHGASRWLIGFTDLTTILLAFFILLFSTTELKNAAWIKASKSMRASFAGSQQITDVSGKPGAVDTERALTAVNQDPGLDLSYLNSLVRRWFKSDPILQPLEAQIEGDYVSISLPADTAFEPGKDALSDKGQQLVAHLAPFLAQLPNTVEIVGHADPQLVDESGRFGSNWHLSLARAYAVAQAMQEAGYAQHMDVRGRGSGDTDALPKNLPDDVRNEQARRIDIRLHRVES